MSYRQWWDSFRSCMDQQEKHLAFLKDSKANLDLVNVRSAISIGAGCGDIDVPFIKECLPNLETYIALEPDADNRESLQESLRSCPNINTLILDEKIPDWTGPKTKVDLILAIQVMWYVPYSPHVYEQLISWLRKGGKLILGHSCDDFPLARLSETIKGDGSREYFLSEMLEDLNKAGLEKYNVFFVPCNLNVKDLNEKQIKALLNFETTDLTKAQNMQLLQLGTEILQQKGESVEWNNVFVVVQKT